MIMKPRQFINDGYVQNYYSKSHTLRGAFIEWYQLRSEMNVVLTLLDFITSWWQMSDRAATSKMEMVAM